MTHTPDKTENVEIGKSRYQELLRAESKLIALENGGVDNWEWYDEAMDTLTDEDDD